MKNSIDDITKETLTEYFDNHTNEIEGKIETIECEARDGFIPYSHNKGGFTCIGFTYVGNIVGSGYFPSHKEAATDIQKQQDYMLECLSEEIYAKYKELFDSLGLTDKDGYYHKIGDIAEKDPRFEKVQSDIENGECCMGDGQDSVMYELRVMYHDDNKASVSAVVNTEGPYHRSFISWAKDVFCEGAKEVGIEWVDKNDYATKLKDALDTVIKPIF